MDENLTAMLPEGVDLKTFIRLSNGRVELVGDVFDGSLVADEIDLLACQRHKRIRLFITSHGGDVSAGIRIIRAIEQAQAQGIEVVGTVRGMAGSMAFLILQACSERRMGRADVLMAHGITMSMWGGDSNHMIANTKLLDHWNSYFGLFMVRRIGSRQGLPSASLSYWQTIFKDETPVYYSAEEAIGARLVDVIE